MGDLIHTLPAATALKQAHPDALLTWVVEPKWMPLLSQNPFVDRIVPLQRDSLGGLLATRRELRESKYDFAVDFQGLIKSVAVAFAAKPGRIYGFEQVRESLARTLYDQRIAATATHVVDRNLELAVAAGAVRGNPVIFPLPTGEPEGELPDGNFVLASPLAGWASKQWPMAHYRILAQRLREELGIPLVLNGAPASNFEAVDAAVTHYSGLPGLIDATRRASAVLGVDSGPMHLAAALGKPGVAIFGPTDPARNGPYGGTIRVLRTDAAVTTYKRGTAIDESMQQISPDQVFEALRTVLYPARCSA